MKKKNMFLLFFCVCTNMLFAQNSLIITAPGGGVKGIALAGVKKITFASGSMNVYKTDASSEVFLLTDINKLTFGILSGVNEICGVEGYRFYPGIVSDYLYCSDLPAQLLHQVNIYSISGQKMSSASMSGSEIVLDMSHLTSGVYLVNIDGVVRKIIKK